MTPENKQKLYAIVDEYVVEYGYKSAHRCIASCHNGRLDGYLCTNENLHLFRQYRNYVSADPARLIDESLSAC